MPTLSIAFLALPTSDGKTGTEPLVAYVVDLGATLARPCARPMAPAGAGPVCAELVADVAAAVEIGRPPFAVRGQRLTLRPGIPVRVRVEPGQRVGARVASVASPVPLRPGRALRTSRSAMMPAPA